MKIFRWFAVTFSMYSKIPMPVFEWKDDDMAHSLTFFPMVGVVIGLIVCIINGLAPVNTLPVAVRIILTILTPFMITGGFHVDGFMDTEDAMNSYASREKKLEILKDAHIGAFAVISLIKWLLICGAAVTAILLSENCDIKCCEILGITFVISRCLSGLTSLLFTKAKKTGMLHEETKNKQNGTIIFLLLQLIIACVLLLYIDVVYGAAVIISYILTTVYYRYKAYKEFGGVTGDTAGFFVTIGEIMAAVFLAITMYII